ncbi:basic leucine zipper 4 [Sesamum indicum]|uniref:Basic leucine zipper 4 n=1 Tax=Sesamum indicum TaxID=4182 RepID=A0A6I9SW37_SESIN|nr:basic leucine zipper 4 [Sesamum indicum]
MLSTSPAVLFSDSSQFPPFAGGFPPWVSHEPPFLFHPPLQDQEPVSSNNSGSETSKPPPAIPNSSSDEPNPKPLGSIIDERKRRRMISNRESARRSRMRKQKHLENLRTQLNRLRTVNGELTNRVRWVVHQDQLVRRQNEHLRSEAVVLRQRLWDIRQVLLVRQLHQQLNPSPAWPCNNFTSTNEGQLITHQSLIT